MRASLVDPLPILQDLVKIPSVNPMGRNVSGPEYYEGRMTDYLVDFFKRLGVSYERIEVLPNRHNVIARLDRPGCNTTLLLDAHQDTVPIEGMTIDPFGAEIKEGRLYGRGACDMKGGMAAILAAFTRLLHDRPAQAANVVISCTCDEESTAQGVLDLGRLWTDPSRKGSLVSTAPDFAITAEPTDLDIVVAHRGATRWKIKTTGRACHSSRPEEGVNAIYKMAHVVRCLEQYAQELPGMRPPHPKCGPATISVGRIEGGISVNVVPDECTIEIDRRSIPGEDGEEIMDQVATFLRRRLDFDFEMLPPWLVGATLSDDNNGPWTDRLMVNIEAVVGKRKKMGVAYGTNASRISAAGVPSAVFGPGSINQAHTKDEWISIDEVRQASEIFYQFCATAGAT